MKYKVENRVSNSDTVAMGSSLQPTLAGKCLSGRKKNSLIIIKLYVLVQAESPGLERKNKTAFYTHVSSHCIL